MSGSSIRLVHGPFDGDEGAMQKLPRTIWATDCLEDHGRDGKGKAVPCDQGGVHWLGDPSPQLLHGVKARCAHLEVRCERYKKDQEVAGVRTYVWADLKGNPKVVNKGREREPVGANG